MQVNTCCWTHQARPSSSEEKYLLAPSVTPEMHKKQTKNKTKTYLHDISMHNSLESLQRMVLKKEKHLVKERGLRRMAKAGQSW